MSDMNSNCVVIEWFCNSCSCEVRLTLVGLAAGQHDPDDDGEAVDVRFLGGAVVDALQVLRSHVAQSACGARTRPLALMSLSARLLFSQLAPRLRRGQTEIRDLMQSKQDKAQLLLLYNTHAFKAALINVSVVISVPGAHTQHRYICSTLYGSKLYICILCQKSLGY